MIDITATVTNVNLAIQNFAAPQDSLLAAPPPLTSNTYLDIVMQGGLVMIPLAILSILTVYLFIERLNTLRRAKTDPNFITDRTRRYIQAGDIRGAILSPSRRCR